MIEHKDNAETVSETTFPTAREIERARLAAKSPAKAPAPSAGETVLVRESADAFDELAETFAKDGEVGRADGLQFAAGYLRNQLALAAAPAPSAGETRAAIIGPPEGAVAALAAYQQADMDGCMVLVSRQAIDECLPALRALASIKQEPT